MEKTWIVKYLIEHIKAKNFKKIRQLLIQRNIWSIVIGGDQTDIIELSENSNTHWQRNWIIILFWIYSTIANYKKYKKWTSFITHTQISAANSYSAFITSKFPKFIILNILFHLEFINPIKNLQCSFSLVTIIIIWNIRIMIWWWYTIPIRNHHPIASATATAGNKWCINTSIFGRCAIFNIPLIYLRLFVISFANYILFLDDDDDDDNTLYNTLLLLHLHLHLLLLLSIIINLIRIMINEMRLKIGVSFSIIIIIIIIINRYIIHPLLFTSLFF